MKFAWAVAVLAAISTNSLAAEPQSHPIAEVQALDLAKQAISLRSVRGPGNQTPQVAELLKAALVKGGFPAQDVAVTPMDDTAYLIARWRGSDPKLKPLVICGHMDVVAADPADWERDPFTPVVENGYLFGRGASDMKLSGATVLAALIELKRQGYVPRRDIVVAFSGDEETSMRTSAALAERLAGAELAINVDGGRGVLDDKTGAPLYFTWQAAEKTYADFRLTVVNPGGHSSQPRADNAIYRLSAALLRIQAHQFKPELNPISKAYFVEAARYEPPQIAAAMRAFAADPTDARAIAALTAEPDMVGKIGTTCVVTLVKGGHAENALPQRAEANINCRIFPGHRPAEIMAELQRAANDPQVRFADVSEGSVATEASPLRPDVVTAVQAAMASVYPGVPVFPAISSGASDSMWFRAKGVASYNASPFFSKPSDEFSHGLNERIAVANIRPAIGYYLSLIPALSK